MKFSISLTAETGFPQKLREQSPGPVFIKVRGLKTLGATLLKKYGNLLFSVSAFLPEKADGRGVTGSHAAK